MQKVSGVGMPSAKPYGIPVTELTYGTAVGLAESFVNCCNEEGYIEFGVIVDKDRVQQDIRLVIEVMPWGVLAAAAIKLSNHLIGFLENRSDFRLDIWEEAKRLIIGNAPSVAMITGLEVKKLGSDIQKFVNESMLAFLVDEKVSSITSPSTLDSSEYEYAVAIATLSSALICASASCSGITPSEMLSRLRTELHDSASTAS